MAGHSANIALGLLRSPSTTTTGIATGCAPLPLPRAARTINDNDSSGGDEALHQCSPEPCVPMTMITMGGDSAAAVVLSSFSSARERGG